VVYRSQYPAAFSAGSHHLSWKIGFANTLVLIGSSLTMAMGVYFAAVGRRAGSWPSCSPPSSWVAPSSG